MGLKLTVYFYYNILAMATTLPPPDSVPMKILNFQPFSELSSSTTFSSDSISLSVIPL